MREHGTSDLPLIDWGRRNREAGRPFIEHQLEIADFEVAAQTSAERSGYHYVGTDDIAARILNAPTNAVGRNPLAFRVMVSHRGARHEIGLVPDIAIELRKGSPRNFLVEIDRGTMPITRADFSQTSIERKLRSYLSAYASRLIERCVGWKSFRVLIVTSDAHRVRSMIECLRSIQPPGAAGSSLFLFASHAELRAADPMRALWYGIDGRAHPLLHQ